MGNTRRTHIPGIGALFCQLLMHGSATRVSSLILDGGNRGRILLSDWRRTSDTATSEATLTSNQLYAESRKLAPLCKLVQFQPEQWAPVAPYRGICQHKILDAGIRDYC